jgi:hypothetical protein
MRPVNITFAVLIVTSLMIVLIEYFFPIEYKQTLILDMFDLCIVALLILDVYAKLSKTAEKKSHSILRNWYEIPTMIPLILSVLTDPS